jgi:hypothetical protein
VLQVLSAGPVVTVQPVARSHSIDKMGRRDRGEETRARVRGSEGHSLFDCSNSSNFVFGATVGSP